MKSAEGTKTGELEEKKAKAKASGWYGGAVLAGCESSCSGYPCLSQEAETLQKGTQDS